MSGAGLIGDWGGMVRRLQTLGGRMQQKIERFPNKFGAHLESEIKKGITSQAPGGQQFQALAESTIRRKKSSKALIDTGAMRESVTHQEVVNINTGERGVFVGLLRTQMHRPKDETGDEIEMANLGAIHEYGTDDGHIPARPFIGPVWAVEKPKMEKALVDDVTSVMKR